MTELATGESLREHLNCLINSPTGIGKSWSRVQWLIRPAAFVSALRMCASPGSYASWALGWALSQADAGPRNNRCGSKTPEYRIRSSVTQPPGSECHLPAVSRPRARACLRQFDQGRQPQKESPQVELPEDMT